jgi:aspartyl-tRNA(Asn)/glutamyl-tRNA(Gln) amidotransferase subunit C
MAELSKADVEHIAQLARLHLSEADKETYRAQLSDILEHVSALQRLDTSDVEAARGGIRPDHGARLREDVAGEPIKRSDLLKNAPQQVDNQFRVPPVLD